MAISGRNRITGWRRGRPGNRPPMKPAWCPSMAASSTASIAKGGYNPMWMDWKVLIGMPSDMLIVGYGGHTVHVLRLYAARAPPTTADLQ